MSNQINDKAQEPSKKPDSGHVVGRLFFVNYLLMLMGLMLFTRGVGFSGLQARLFTAVVILAYAFVYLVPAGLLVGLLDRVFRLFRVDSSPAARWLLYAAAGGSLTLTHLIIQVDAIIFRMYGFHFNGFVWNLLTTRGGIESMGFDTAAYRILAVCLMVAIGVEAGLLAGCLYWGRLKAVRLRCFAHRLRMATPYMAAVLFGVQGIQFGVSSFQGKSEVLVAANTFPFYLPITFRGYLIKMGLEPNRNTVLTAEGSGESALNYPLEPLEQSTQAPQYNIVWLVAESWRADMLTEEIMPQTWQFAKRAQYFTNHYSAGNGTRMGLFSMFYGLYGSYWPAFLREQRSPVLMDLLQQEDYQIELYTSARFSYPEFDKTVFSRIPAEHLHEYTASEGWRSDRINVSNMLEWIHSRDPNRPLMTFLFFESPHARYYFPPECEIRKDYLNEFNYATADIEQQIGRIFNRYINSCNHLDTQLARIFQDLENQGLLDTTVVIVTGDHGEEFMEKGRWGHNSSFVEEQIRIPLVLWVPGMKPGVHSEMTSHTDLPATVLQLLGVSNPASDFSQGIDLFSGRQRQYTVLADWDSLFYRDSDFKIALPIKASASFLAANGVTTADDKPVSDSSAAFAKKRDRLTEVLRETGRFLRRGVSENR